MKQLYANTNIDWLENFPEKYRNSIISYERSTGMQADKPVRSARYKKLYEEDEKKPTHPKNINNIHLTDANRNYAHRQPVDRRKNNRSAFPTENCRRSQASPSNNSMQKFSTLRDHYKHDALESRKRLFSNSTTIQPIQIDGLEYSVLIADDFMFIGCIERPIKQWQKISDREILEMDGKAGLEFWKSNKEMLLNACKIHMGKVRSAHSTAAI